MRGSGRASSAATTGGRTRSTAACASARDFGDDSLDLTALSLLEVRVAEWRGLVFVNLDADARALADDHAAFFAAADQPIEDFTYSHRLRHDVAANWKVYCDNYGEGYHVPLVHPALNREIVAKEYRVDVGDHFCAHSAPTRDGAVNAGVWLWRYPNLALNVYPDGMNVERFVPVGHRRDHVVYDYFFRDPDARDENAEVVRVGCDDPRRGPGDLRGGAAQPRIGRVRHGGAQPAPRARRRRVPAVAARVPR